MAYGIKLHCWGDFALFTRPEMKVERVSYDIITPSAARGIVSAIYWKPEIRWVIDRLRVLRPIRFTSQRRNEVGAKIPEARARSAMNAGKGNLGMYIEEERQQRAALLLRDVGYVTDDDLKLFKQALNMMFENDRSAARGRMSPVRCIAFRHENKLGNARADQLFARVTVKLKPDLKSENRPPRSKADYDIAVAGGDLPSGVIIEEWV